MGHLRYVTLTGVDERTDISRLHQIAHAYAPVEVEWGVLYSQERAGTGGRYPSLKWIESFAYRANEVGLNIALHLCGSIVRDLMKAADTLEVSADAQRVFDLAERFGRVQLNVRAKAKDVLALRKLVTKLHRTENRTRVILQWHYANEQACLSLASSYGFEVLVDSSGGNGIERTDWPDMTTSGLQHLGYAGGLGPDNVRAQFDAISTVCKERAFWIDMEGKLRDESDNFDLLRCEAVLGDCVKAVKAQRDNATVAYGVEPCNVAELSDFGLDWWLGYVTGRAVVVPPKDAVRAMALDRSTGEFYGYSPTTDLHLASELMQRMRVAVTPLECGGWRAQSTIVGEGQQLAPAMEAPEPHLAGLRAVLAKYVGLQVPWSPRAPLD